MIVALFSFGNVIRQIDFHHHNTWICVNLHDSYNIVGLRVIQ